MSTDLTHADPQIGADPQAVREAWISARVAEFAADPSLRDRAIASILFDSLMLAQSVGELTGIVQKEGLGGIVGALAGQMNPFGKKKNGT